MPASVFTPVSDLHRRVAADHELPEIVAQVIASGRYHSGTELAAFEAILATTLGGVCAVGVANGTDALELCLGALGSGTRAGDAVMGVANAGGFASVAAARAARPMYYCDVDATLTMSSTSLDQALTAASDRGIRIGTVIVTHLYGRVADVPAIRDVCEHHRRRHGPDGRGPAILEDCSHSFPGAGQRDGPGRWGDAAAWSFYPTKPLGALGDGGAVTTASNDVAQAVKQLAQYGWGRRFDVIRAGGRNSRLDELQAAVLHHRLRVDVAVDGADANETDRDLASQARRRREIANAYRDALPNEVRDLVPPMVDSHACHLAVCRTRDRAGLSSFLADRGIATDIHYPVPDHHQSGISGEAIVPVPNSERACAEVLTLPCFSELTDDEVSRVCLALSNWPPSVAHRRL